MTVRHLAVLAIGLAKLSGTTFAKAALWLFGLWFGLRIGIIFTGLGGAGM